MEDIYNKEAIYEMYRSGEVSALEDIFEVEGITINIKELNDKIAFYKEYKKKKVSAIDNEVKSLTQRIDFLKKIILETLKKNNEKNVTFPGTSKVIVKKSQKTWDIKDEESFIKLLKEEKEYDNVVDEIIEYKIIKKEANKLLEDWKKRNKIPSCVQENIKDDIVAITYLEHNGVETNGRDDNLIISKKDENKNYDSLNF